MQNRKTIEKISERKSQFFDRINDSDKLLTKLMKKIREKTYITSIRNKRTTSLQKTQTLKTLLGNVVNNCMSITFTI